MKKQGYFLNVVLLISLAFAFAGLTAGAPARAEGAYMSTDAANPEEITLEKGQTITITFQNTAKVYWKSDNSAVVSVSQGGAIKAEKEGTARVSADLGGIQYYYLVTVIDKTLDYARAVKTGKMGNLTAGEKKWIARARNIIDETIKDGMTKVEKAKAVHDYLVLHTAYDYKNYNAGTIPAASYTAEGAILRGTAVCQGYAEAYRILMEALDIPCEIITGTAGGPHAWNLIKLGGKWYHVDVTWDDPVPDKKGFVRYDYFLVPDKSIKKDHKWKTKDYPPCTSMKYYYYADKPYIVKSVSQYKARFLKQFREGKKSITVMYPENKYPKLDFIYDYVDSYSYYPLWKKGKYYVLTVVIGG